MVLHSHKEIQTEKSRKKRNETQKRPNSTTEQTPSLSTPIAHSFPSRHYDTTTQMLKSAPGS